MNLIYNIGVGAYVVAVKTAAAFGHKKAVLMEQGRKGWEKFLREKRKEGDRYVWFHASSLGEFEQGRPLMEALRETHPEYKLLVTFFSPSGYEVRKNYKGADIVMYLPYDLRSEARRFVALAKPELAFFVKYEFWGNVLEALREKDVPCYLISGIFRKEQSFFQWYGCTFRPMLGMFRHLFVQDEESKQLLAGIGVEGNVTICGDTRFDRVIAICEQAKNLPWAEAFRKKSAFTLIAGSSWPKDEEILLPHFNRHPEMRLIIAPHEIHESHIEQIMAGLKRPFLRYSEIKPLLDAGQTVEAIAKAESVDCLIIDAIGFLSSIYRYGDAAYIGGGFGVGIHNTLEAAVYGIPVIFGPNHQAFREALGLIDCKGGFPITRATDYEATVDGFIADWKALSEAGEKAGRYVHDNAGATETVFSAVFQ